MTPTGGERDGTVGRAVPRRGLWVLTILVAGSLAGGTPAAGAQEGAPSALRDAVQSGDLEAALRSLGSLSGDTASKTQYRYLRARLLARQGRLGEALRVMGSLAEDDLPEGVLGDLRIRRWKLLARTGHCAEARPGLRRAADEAAGAAGAVLTAVAAECAVQTGAMVEAERELREVVRRDAPGVDTFAAWLALAESLWRGGDAEAAARELRALLVARPEHPEASMVERQLRALIGPVRLTPEERMERAARYLKVRQPKGALEELAAAKPPGGRADRRRWFHLRGMALFGTRHDYPEAARELDRAARLGGPTAIEDAFHAARALARAGRGAQAIQAYRRLMKQHPRHRLAAKAEYLAALVELGRHDARGAAALQRFLTGPRAALSAGDARKARWHLAMRDYRRGRFADAAEGFRRYARSSKGALVEARGHYWRGRALEAAGQRSAAVVAHRAAMAVEVRHWYAVLAEGRLIGLGEQPERPPLPQGAAEASLPDLPQEVRFYTDLGLTVDARGALRRAEDAIRAVAGLQGVVAAHAHIGHWSRAYRLAALGMADALRRWPEADALWAWRAAYPRPFHDAVSTEATVHGVPEALLYAVMRQESGYDPEAESYAGAIGLMQLMPRTARSLSSEAAPVRLFDPHFNVRLGAQLLAQLLKEFDGSLPLAVAAYNAGSHRVRAWRRAHPDADVDLFVERIPIDQTRNYVRRVLSHYASYRLLEGDPQPSLATLP
jgi:soluble lytic murein transglycosylase